MKKLKLTNSDQFILVDDEDFDRCKLHKWCLNGRDHNKIASGILVLNGKYISFANFIMETENVLYDHKDRNFLNNQKENLRSANYSQNGANRDKYKNNISSYKGVYYCERDKGWRAQMHINKKNKNLGTYSTKERAAAAYNKAALKYFGEFAHINILKNEEEL